MINKLTDDFESFIQEISLNQTIVDDIIEKHNSLTEMIKNDPPENYKIIKTRLSGSYAKHTVLNEYEKDKKPDVDVIVIIDNDNKSVYQVNNDFLEYLKKKKEKVVSNVRQQSNSIGLIYSNISVDIVLAKEENGILKIASHKEDKWIESNSLRHVKYMEKQNKKYESFNYHDLMKLFKYLNKEILTYKIKSFTLEQLVHQCAPDQTIGLRIYQAFAKTLENISNINSIEEIKDCCDNSKKGYDDKDTLTFNQFIIQIKEFSDMSKEALSGNRKKWEEIFGERFPIQPEEKVENKEKYDKSQTPWCNRY